MTTKGVAEEMQVFIVAVFNEFVNEFMKAANCGMKQIEVEQGQYRHYNFIVVPEIFNQFGEVTECAKQAMQQNQRFTSSFFYEFEFVNLFDLVIHQFFLSFVQLIAKVIVLV